MGEIPKWPEKPSSEKTGDPSLSWPDANIFDVEAYQSARADAAIARLKVAVEALNCVLGKDCEWASSALEFNECDGFIKLTKIEHAVAQIGPIPE